MYVFYVEWKSGLIEILTSLKLTSYTRVVALFMLLLKQTKSENSETL